LESDRGCALICQAAAEGLIDFSKAQLLDRYWWKRLDILLYQLEKRNYYDVIKTQHNQCSNALTYCDDDEIFKSYWKSCNDLLNDLYSSYFSWVKEKELSKNNDVIKQLREEYIANFGDPDTPEAKQRIANTVNFLMNR